MRSGARGVATERPGLIGLAELYDVQLAKICGTRKICWPRLIFMTNNALI